MSTLIQATAAIKNGGCALCGTSVALTFLADNHLLITAIAGVVGVLLAVLGYVTNLYFRLKQDKREALELKLNIKKKFTEGRRV